MLPYTKSRLHINTGGILLPRYSIRYDNINGMIYSARASISLLSRSRFCLIFSSSIISFTFISLV